MEKSNVARIKKVQDLSIAILHLVRKTDRRKTSKAALQLPEVVLDVVFLPWRMNDGCTVNSRNWLARLRLSFSSLASWLDVVVSSRKKSIIVSYYTADMRHFYEPNSLDIDIPVRS